MIAWTGIEHFQMGRYDPPPPACEPADALVSHFPFFFWLLEVCNVTAFGLRMLFHVQLSRLNGSIFMLFVASILSNVN